MKHLTADEIIGFVSLKRADICSVAVSAKVNSHIRGCRECFDRVKAFQAIHDEFSALGVSGSPEDYLARMDWTKENRPDRHR